MQGFPIGGGRIRLSWGRSQYKATQAAAQAAQLGLGLGALTGLNGLTPAQAAQLGLALQGLGGLGGGNTNLLHQLAVGGQGSPSGVGVPNQFLPNGRAGPAAGSSTGGLPGHNGIGGGFGGLPGGGGGVSPGSFGGVAGLAGLGNAIPALAGLSPQTLQTLLSLSGSGLGGTNSGAGAGGGLNPALLARLAAQGGLAGFSPHDDQLQQQQDGNNAPDGNLGFQQGGGQQQQQQSNFAPFSPAQSPITNTPKLPQNHQGDDRRHSEYAPAGRFRGPPGAGGGGSGEDEYEGFQQNLANSSAERDSFMASMYQRQSTGGPLLSPTSTTTRIPGSFSGPPSSLRTAVTSPGSNVSSVFDPDYRANGGGNVGGGPSGNIPPPLQSTGSYSSETLSSSRYFGAFSPPATAPGGMAAAQQDYLQQQQQNSPGSRARAASASVHSSGGAAVAGRELAAEMENLDVSGSGGAPGRQRPAGSGRSFGYGSFAGTGLRTQQLAGSRYGAGGRGGGATGSGEGIGRFDENAAI